MLITIVAVVVLALLAVKLDSLLDELQFGGN